MALVSLPRGGNVAVQLLDGRTLRCRSEDFSFDGRVAQIVTHRDKLSHTAEVVALAGIASWDAHVQYCPDDAGRACVADCKHPRRAPK